MFYFFYYFPQETRLSTKSLTGLFTNCALIWKTSKATRATQCILHFHWLARRITTHSMLDLTAETRVGMATVNWHIKYFCTPQMGNTTQHFVAHFGSKFILENSSSSSSSSSSSYAICSSSGSSSSSSSSSSSRWATPHQWRIGSKFILENSSSSITIIIIIIIIIITIVIMLRKGLFRRPSNVEVTKH